jgi:hypothetical protein
MQRAAHDVDANLLVVVLGIEPAERLAARPLAEQHAVAGFDVKRVQRAIFITRTGAYGDDFAFHRFFLRGVRDDDASGTLRLVRDTANKDAVLQWTQLHGWSFRTEFSGFGTVTSEAPLLLHHMGRRAPKYNERNTLFRILRAFL